MRDYDQLYHDGALAWINGTFEEFLGGMSDEEREIFPNAQRRFEEMERAFDVEKKVKNLALQTITEDVKKKLNEYYIGINAPAQVMVYDAFDYVLWHQGKPFFYTQKFLEEHNEDEIKRFVEGAP